MNTFFVKIIKYSWPEISEIKNDLWYKDHINEIIEVHKDTTDKRFYLTLNLHSILREDCVTFEFDKDLKIQILMKKMGYEI